MRLGEMTMPADFRYREVFLRGRPRHRREDGFRLRHPAMEREKRAKIFSPFDALRGFSDAVAAKDVLYVDRPELSGEEQLEIGRRLSVLQRLARNGRAVRAHPAQVSVTYFSPCEDEDSFSFGRRGQLRTVSGVCRGVDSAVSGTVTVGGAAIRFQDIVSIEAERIFDEEWETDPP